MSKSVKKHPNLSFWIFPVAILFFWVFRLVDLLILRRIRPLRPRNDRKNVKRLIPKKKQKVRGPGCYDFMYLSWQDPLDEKLAHQLHVSQHLLLVLDLAQKSNLWWEITNLAWHFIKIRAFVPNFDEILNFRFAKLFFNQSLEAFCRVLDFVQVFRLDQIPCSKNKSKLLNLWLKEPRPRSGALFRPEFKKHGEML